MKIIWHQIFIQTLLFQGLFFPTRQNGVENRDKAYSNSFLAPGDGGCWSFEVIAT